MNCPHCNAQLIDTPHRVGPLYNHTIVPGYRHSGGSTCDLHGYTLTASDLADAPTLARLAAIKLQHPFMRRVRGLMEATV